MTDSTDSKEASQGGLSYHIIITGINESLLPQAVKEFALACNLTDEISGQILKNSPITFLSNLSRNEMKSIKPKLLYLSKSGIEFTVSPTLSPDIPGVIWPIPSYYKQIAGGKILNYIDYQCDNNAFICPKCGESFIFQRINNPFVSFEQLIKQLSVPPPAPEKEEVKDVLPENVVPEDKVMELAPLEVEEDKVEPLPVLEEEVVEEVKEEIVEAPEIVEEPLIEEGDCALILKGVNSKEKRDYTAKVIAEIKNISFEEAIKLIQYTSTPVIEGLTEADSSKCLKMLQEIRVTGRITK